VVLGVEGGFGVGRTYLKQGFEPSIRSYQVKLPSRVANLPFSNANFGVSKVGGQVCRHGVSCSFNAMHDALPPTRIEANDPKLVEKLDQFHRWFWPPEVRREPAHPTTSAADTRILPTLLRWAMNQNQLGEHSFVADEYPGGQLCCFIECGGAFRGFIDAGDQSDNPTVSFDVDWAQPVPLNDLVIGAFFESLGFSAFGEERSDGLPTHDFLLWTGKYFGSENPAQVWLEGDQVFVNFGPIFDEPLAISRPVLDTSAEVKSFSVEVFDTPLFRLNLARGTDVDLDTFRTGTPPDPGSPVTMAAWSDISRMRAESRGFEHSGTTTIPWSQIEPLWVAVTRDLQASPDEPTSDKVHVFRVGSDLGYYCAVGDKAALENLRTLLRNASLGT
jgi:hypothetical protein